MNRHLVAVEVGVERGTCKGVQLDGAALYQHRLKCLYAQAVQRRRAVEEYGVLFYYVLQYVPDLGLYTLYHALRALYVVCVCVLNKLLHYEGLEQLQRHLLWQSALIHLELRAYDYNGTAGIVHALAQQVLTETSLLTAQHVGQRLEGPIAGAGNRASTPAVIYECIHRLLKHALFVAHYDIRRTQLQQSLEAVVSVYNSAVQVVQVRRGKPAAVQLYHRAKLGGQHWHCVHDYPLGLVAALYKGFHYLQALDGIAALLAGGVVYLPAELFFQLFKVQRLQKLLYGLCSHTCAEGFRPVLGLGVPVFLIGEHLLVHEGGGARIQHYKGREVQHLFEGAGGHIQQHLHAAGNALKIPYMGYGGGQLYVAHALAAHLCPRYLYAALVADNALVAHPLIASAVALPVLGGPEYALAKQAVALGLQGTVVYGFGFLYLAVGPFADLFR